MTPTLAAAICGAAEQAPRLGAQRAHARVHTHPPRLAGLVGTQEGGARGGDEAAGEEASAVTLGFAVGLSAEEARLGGGAGGREPRAQPGAGHWPSSRCHLQSARRPSRCGSEPPPRWPGAPGPLPRPLLLWGAFRRSRSLPLYPYLASRWTRPATSPESLPRGPRAPAPGHHARLRLGSGRPGPGPWVRTSRAGLRVESRPSSDSRDVLRRPLRVAGAGPAACGGDACGAHGDTPALPAPLRVSELLPQ